MSARNPIAAHVLALYRRGELATLEEGAMLADTSRARVQEWLLSAGIDWQRERLRHLAKKRQRMQEIAAGKIRKRPSKAQQRAQAQRLVDDYRRKKRDR